MAFSSSSSYFCGVRQCIRGFVLLASILGGASQSCNVSSVFRFDIHHRFTDRVRAIMPLDQMPAKGTADYVAAMAHRDRIQGRRLTGGIVDQTLLTGGIVDQTLLTFVNGNATFQLSEFGYLYYANVTVGTPGLDFLVALDTGSSLFWLPCDCDSCMKVVKFGPDQVDTLNIYSLSTSSTGTQVPCNSTLCRHSGSCSATTTECPYQLKFLSANTTSSGYLVEDVLRLTTDSTPSKRVDANITLGCGKIETGSFLDDGAPNGLFGLGIDNISVPSILASQNIAANSFSMCFGPDGSGRISFGDKGSSDQSETLINLGHLHPTYNVSVTQISVGANFTDVDFSAIFDSGTSFTHLGGPAYTTITEGFNSQVNENRHAVDSNFSFEYCYDSASCDGHIALPTVNLTMKGGAQFYVYNPILLLPYNENECMYCLAVVKSDDFNIIGENFMTGYRVVFDRERMVLGWKALNCSYTSDTTTLPISPRSSAVAPFSMDPEATPGANNGSHISGTSSLLNHQPYPLKPWTWAFLFFPSMIFHIWNTLSGIFEPTYTLLFYPELYDR